MTPSSSPRACSGSFDRRSVGRWRSVWPDLSSGHKNAGPSSAPRDQQQERNGEADLAGLAGAAIERGPQRLHPLLDPILACDLVPSGDEAEAEEVVAEDRGRVAEPERRAALVLLGDAQ